MTIDRRPPRAAPLHEQKQIVAVAGRGRDPPQSPPHVQILREDDARVPGSTRGRRRAWSSVRVSPVALRRSTTRRPRSIKSARRGPAAAAPRSPHPRCAPERSRKRSPPSVDSPGRSPAVEPERQVGRSLDSASQGAPPPPSRRRSSRQLVRRQHCQLTPPPPAQRAASTRAVRQRTQRRAQHARDPPGHHREPPGRVAGSASGIASASHATRVHFARSRSSRSASPYLRTPRPRSRVRGGRAQPSTLARRPSQRTYRHRRASDRDVHDRGLVRGAPSALRLRPSRQPRMDRTRFTGQRLLERFAVPCRGGEPQRHLLHAERAARVVHEQVDRSTSAAAGARDPVRASCFADDVADERVAPLASPAARIRRATSLATGQGAVRDEHDDARPRSIARAVAAPETLRWRPSRRS